MRKFSGFAKILIIIFLTLSISGSVFLFPKSAGAQGVTIRLEAIADNIWESVTRVADKISKQASAAAFKTALSQFLNKVAYDMAIAVATGAPGQKSLIFDDPSYFLNLGDAVMGNAIDDIAKESGFTNLLGTGSLCEPADLTTKVNLLLSFKTPTEPPKPRCSLSQMSKSLSESANSFNNSFSLANLSLRFEMGDLEEARNSLRKSLTVEKYLDQSSAIYSNFNTALSDLEKTSDDLSGLIQRIYQKPIAERQAAAESELKNLSEVQTRLILTQNRISQIQELINNCGSESGNCTESGAVGVCQYFIASPVQMNCSAAVSTAQTYHSQFQKLETDLTDGMNNLYSGILEKAFTVPDASDPKDISNAFNPESNPMSQFFLIKEAKDRDVSIKIENEKLLQRISKDCEPKKDPVSGMNVLPASAACGMFNFAMSKATVNEGTYTGIFSQAVSIFTNTLAGKLMQTWFEKGVANLFDKGKGKNSTSAADLASGGAPRGKGAAEERFLTLLQSNFTAGGPFEVLRELTTCPEQGAGPNNCIIDPDFSQAIAERLTLKEAMDKKLLDPKRPFGYIKSGSILVEPSYLSGYPYRSMIVLRKFRIIPVGWELAAEWIKDPGKNTNKISYTLKQVVDCYENTSDCVFNVNNGEPNPFYHLVDPGWVFLEQPAFCKRQGAGEKILAEEFICSRPDMAKQDGSCLEYSRNVYRQEYCADEQTCLLKNDDGSCRFYGYCSLDQPTWKLDGATCNQEYNSCQTYGNKDGANVSYLEHTISSGGCNAGNAGCQWYCEEAPLICLGGSKNGESCSSNNDCVPTAGGIVDGICRPTDLWKCQGKNLIANGGVEINSNGWIGFGTGSNNRIDTSGHESFGSLSSQSSGAESGFSSIQFSTSAVCIGGSDAGKSCTLNSDCSSVICKNNETIDASAWVNPGDVSSDFNSGAAIRIRTFDGGASEVQRMESERITDLNIWKPAHISAVITDTTAKSFILELISYGNGTTATFDDVGLFRGNRISFDKDVKQCEAKDAGCHEFARTTNGANLIFNPSFEIEEKNFSEAPTAGSNWYGWHLKPLSGGTIIRDTAVKSGKASLKADVPAGPNMTIGLETADPRNNLEEDYKLIPDDAYTFSIYAKSSAATCTDCLELVGDCRLGAVNEQSQSFSLTDKWERYSFNYVKNNNDGDYCVFSIRLDPSNTYWLDDAKIEIGSQSTNYKDYGSEKIYLNDSRLSCDLSEVGCESYTSVDGDVGIPAVARNSDQCPAECVGYETYHEIPSYFDPVEDAAADVVFPNFIPSTAAQCSAQAAGCEEFTNLDTVASGGEAKEYYTYIRQCAKPGTTTEATFYTWEGSEEAGFQLRAWRLKANADGTPFTMDGSNACDLDDPDCRVFYTQSGQPYERPLSKAVFISDDCHPLRRTVQGTRQDCENSGGHTDTPIILGDLDIVICLYDSIPFQGIKCAPQYAGCREYKGPQANNQQSLFKSDFEDASNPTDGWGPGTQNNESVSVGGKSLSIGAPYETQRDVSSLVQKSKGYLLKFWAKAATNNDTSIYAFFKNDDGDPLINFGGIKISQEWNSYIIGPADFTSRDPINTEKLLIREGTSLQPFYIDNIEFIEVADDVFVIKDSWKTPVSCDLNPLGISKILSTGGPDLNATDIIIPLNDTGSLPPSGDILIDSEIISYDNIIVTGVSAVRRGERGTTPAVHSNGAKVLLLEPGYALHCSTYTDRAKNKHNLKSFSKLCREDHVGCELLADTQNAQNPFSEWKSGEYAPADVLTPIVNDDKKYCDGKFKGCQKFGRPEIDAGDSVTSWNSVYLINNPDNYKEILCQNTENWCREYKTPDGTEKYFKDPGQKLCEYKENIGVGNTVTSGWFIKGQYEKINPPECAGAMRHCSKDRNGSYLFCRQPGDCQPIGKNGLPEDLGTCIAKDTEWVRECPETQSSCTEYKDPLFSQTQGVKDGYYYLADTIDEGRCKGQINEDQKCVAFNNSEKPVMSLRASGTCKADSAVYCVTNADCRRIPPDGTGNPDDICLMKSDNPFDPQACTRCSVDQLTCSTDPNSSNPCCDVIVANLSASPPIMPACNANTILYVQKDRDCREWLSCVSSAKITNGKGEKEEVCYDVARCTEIDPVTGACLEQATDINYCQNPKCNIEKSQCLFDSSVACTQDSDCANIEKTKRRCSSDPQCARSVGPCNLAAKVCQNDNTRACPNGKDYECLVDQGNCIADDQTFDSPVQNDVPPHIGVVDNLRYRSGFNPYGLHWLDGDADPSNDPLRDGEYLPTATMQKGQVILLEDGDFEKQNSPWSRFSNCSASATQCVNNSTCFAGDTCDLGAGTCTVSNTSCTSNNQCSIADSCGGVCSNNNTIRCRDNKDCGASGTCNYSSPICFVSGGACADAQGMQDDSLCPGSDVCSKPQDFEYERIKVISGLRSLKLDPGQNAFQGNYPGAVNFNDTKPIFVAGNTQIALSGYLNTVDLKNGTAEIEIQEFKNGANAFEYEIPTAAVIMQELGKPWKFYAGIFQTKPETVSIRIVLKNTGTGGTAYFDNILMMPVLNYQNQSYPIPFLEVYEPDDLGRPGDNPFIGRSCRLYPQTNAPACSYTNEQKQQFLGWRGFCAEPDPVNPLQCLQWLPIDQLQGEAGMGFKTESSYSGRTPLYYCAEMSLWQLRCNSRDGGQWNGYSQNECPTSSGIDSSCPTTYSKTFNRSGSWFNRTGSAYCWVNQVSGRGNNRDCFWVPYRSCPYGTKDIAKDISPNLIGRCDKLVEVVDAEGENIAWTNRLEQKSFQSAAPSGYIYTADQNNPLYGSVLVYDAGDQTPDQWQKSFGEEFIRLGTAVRDDTTIAKNNGSVDPTYPLWIVPKSEDIKTCDNDQSIICINNSQCGGGNCVANNAMACVLSSGGSPAACNNSYCYNNAPNPPQMPRQCSATDPARSFEISVSQTVGSSKTPPASAPYPQNSSKTNKETFIQGVKRLQHLFAKSYSSYVWNAGQCAVTDFADICAGTCSGGSNNGASCIDNSYCDSGVCSNMNQETGNSCDMSNNQGYRCDGSPDPAKPMPCVNESDSVCATNGWGFCVWGGFQADCNNPAGRCTPAGGGVCQDSTSGYVQKTCSATCLGGSCVPTLRCSISDAPCATAGDSCGAGGICASYDRCSNNAVVSCSPTSDCSPIASNQCPGGGQCQICDSMGWWGTGCASDGDQVCQGGDRDGFACSYTPVCTSNRCVDTSSNKLGFCIDNTQCAALICSSTDINSGCVNIGDSCDSGNGTCLSGGTCQPAAQQVCIPGGYNADESYEGLKACSIDTDCAGTTSYNSCSRFNDRCALQDLGGVVTGVEKAGMYCNDNNACRSADGLDNGVCATNWCSDGPFIQFQCANTNPDCLLTGAEFTYVKSVDISDPAPDPRFAQTLWTPPAGQCPVNQRPNIVQPPTQDIITETGEMCGVAPEIKFISKPGDPSAPVDIEIDAGNSVTINFLTMIDAEQRPIRQIIVDWGDPLLGQSSIGPYPDGTGLSPKTLATDPFIFTSSPYTTQNLTGYTITVMVQDNWNWCNGTANGMGNYGSACDCLPDADSVCTNWIKFPGKIIVK